jgi:hypothetical protein
VSGGFTVDGNYLDDVWAIIISEIDGENLLNGYGWSGSSRFRFTMFGNDENPLVSVSMIIFILNDDNPELFTIDGAGVLTVGLGEDIVLWQESVSINGGEFGDISDIFFDEEVVSYSLDSVELSTTIPEPTTMGLLVFGAVSIIVRRRRCGR